MNLPRVVALILCAFLLGCGGGDGSPGIPTLPVPIPSPTAEPTVPRLTFPLRTSGTTFRDSLGREVYILGATPCCGEPSRTGWPLSSQGVLEEIAQSGGNYTHIRLGPFSRDLEEGPNFQPTEDFWARVGDILRTADSLGIVVEVDVIDSWAMKRAHDLNFFGWTCEDTQRAPDGEQLSWVATVRERLSGHRNLLLQISNEAFLCHSSERWEGVIAYHLRPLGVPIGSNLHREAAYADYLTVHGSMAIPSRGRPTMVNEITDYLTPEEWEREARAARGMGSSFHLWRGEMGEEEWRDSLQRMRGIIQ